MRDYFIFKVRRRRRRVDPVCGASALGMKRKYGVKRSWSLEWVNDRPTRPSSANRTLSRARRRRLAFLVSLGVVMRPSMDQSASLSSYRGVFRSHLRRARTQQFVFHSINRLIEAHGGFFLSFELWHWLISKSNI